MRFEVAEQRCQKENGAERVKVLGTEMTTRSSSRQASQATVPPTTGSHGSFTLPIKTCNSLGQTGAHITARKQRARITRSMELYI